MDIIFMGTPEFSVPALRELINKKWHISAVITQPDKPAGRKQETKPSPVKELALKNSLPLLQPKSLRSAETIKKIKELRPNIIIVVAYGKMIPAEILNISKYGCVNIHPSLLPKYRGPSPIQSAILNGDKKTGLTVMLLDEGMDSGPILAQEKIGLSGDETAGTLHDKLAELGAKMLLPAIARYIEGKIKPMPQDSDKATICKIISREDGHIDWNRSAKDIERQFRAFYPWPGVYTFWKDKRLKITDLSISKKFPAEKKGMIIEKDNRLYVACSDGSIEIKKLQLEGKKEMKAAEFLKGRGEITGSTVL